MPIAITCTLGLLAAGALLRHAIRPRSVVLQLLPRHRPVAEP